MIPSTRSRTGSNYATKHVGDGIPIWNGRISKRTSPRRRRAVWRGWLQNKGSLGHPCFTPRPSPSLLLATATRYDEPSVRDFIVHYSSRHFLTLVSDYPATIHPPIQMTWREAGSSPLLKPLDLSTLSIPTSSNVAHAHPGGCSHAVSFW